MKPRILIVDDDTSIVESLSERFQARGYRVTTAGTGEEALEKADARPDIILLDLQLPKGDGISVLKKLREEEIDSTMLVSSSTMRMRGIQSA